MIICTIGIKLAHLTLVLGEKKNVVFELLHFTIY